MAALAAKLEATVEAEVRRRLDAVARAEADAQEEAVQARLRAVEESAFDAGAAHARSEVEQQQMREKAALLSRDLEHGAQTTGEKQGRSGV